VGAGAAALAAARDRSERLLARLAEASSLAAAAPPPR
jgi:hypothetical protein